MQIAISGRHVEITDGIRESVNSKFAKIGSHYPELDTLNIILTVERHEQKIEANTQYRGASVSVHASNLDLYTAIAEAVKKMEAALSHRKGTTKANLHQKPVLTAAEDEA